MTQTIPGLEDEALEAARRGLVDRFGHKKETVAGWSSARVLTVFKTRCIEEAAAVARADAKAAAIDGVRQPQPALFRWAAADYLSAALGEGADAAMLAVSYSVCHLQDDELVRLAAYMRDKFNTGRPS